MFVTWSARSYFRFLILAVLSIASASCVPLKSTNEPALLKSERSYLRVGPHMQYLRDPGGRLEFEEVLARSEKFKRVRGYYPAFGITSDAVWLKFTIVPATAVGTNWILELATPLMAEARLYRLDSRSDVHRDPLVLRENTPIADRYYAHHNFVFPLGEIQQTETIYLRVASNAALNVPAFLWNSKSFPMWDMLRTFGYGFFFGLMLVMALYNFFLFVSIRDAAYLYYVLYILDVSLFFSFITGHAAYLLPSDSLHWMAMLGPPTSLIAAGFALQFSRSFLLIRKQMPGASRLIDVILAVNICAILLMPFLNPQQMVVLGNVLPLASIGVLLACATHLARKGFRPAYYFLLAWATLILGVVLFVLQNLGLIPSGFITQYGLFIGAGLEAVLLSLALGYRINLLKEADAESRRLLVAEQATALERERRMSDSFARFVPQEFLQYLGKDSVLEISRGDVIRKDMSVLFMDIRGFTGLSERLGPDVTFAFLNNFHGLLEPVIQNHGGFIDKFIGDAIMALFPDPLQSIYAAIAMQQTLREEVAMRAKYDLRIGVGVHCGDVMLGTVGSPRRLETTVIGDTVNVASRIEGVNKVYGTEIVISDAANKFVRDDPQIISRELDAIRVRGKTRPIVLYELLNTLPDDIRERRMQHLGQYMTALLAYRTGNFAESRLAFQAYTRALQDEGKGGEDGAAAVYLSRLERLLAAPPRDWDGIWSGA